jgi:hypothetical protein
MSCGPGSTQTRLAAARRGNDTRVRHDEDILLEHEHNSTELHSAFGSSGDAVSHDEGARDLGLRKA